MKKCQGLDIANFIHTKLGKKEKVEQQLELSDPSSCCFPKDSKHRRTHRNITLLPIRAPIISKKNIYFISNFLQSKMYKYRLAFQQSAKFNIYSNVVNYNITTFVFFLICSHVFIISATSTKSSIHRKKDIKFLPAGGGSICPF